MDFQNVKIRCSSIHKIMTAPQGKTYKEQWADATAEQERLQALYDSFANKQSAAQAKRYSKIQELKAECKRIEPLKDIIEMGATCKTYLQELYLEQRYGRRQEFTSKYIEKGKLQEELGITLFSLYYRDQTNKTLMFKKNDIRIENKFLSGEPDLFIGDNINEAEEGFDIKCPYSVWTFPFFETELINVYKWQNVGYMALTGAKRWTTVYTLVNAPFNLIDDEKRRVWYAMNCPDETDPTYIAKCVEIEKNMIYDMRQFMSHNPHYDLHAKEWANDIPRAERVKTFTVERNETEIQQVYDTVARCREYMTKTFGSNTIIAHHDKEVQATIVEQA